MINIPNLQVQISLSSSSATGTKITDGLFTLRLFASTYLQFGSAFKICWNFSSLSFILHNFSISRSASRNSPLLLILFFLLIAFSLNSFKLTSGEACWIYKHNKHIPLTDLHYEVKPHNNLMYARFFVAQYNLKLSIYNIKTSQFLWN